ncbi:MAG TPA: helix-turn-helix domain-containing protein [Acidimicrobiales bacterium]|nr:helix-turn-helix domain-containing protein [Acidimicrobiales bacterium]
MKARSASGQRVAEKSVLQSVQRAVAVMREIARHRRPVSIAELTTALGLERTIVHRIVRTLEGEQLVEAARGGYRLGPMALLFGNSYLDTLSVRRVALPYLVDLLERVIHGRPWSASLLIRINDEVSSIETLYNAAAPLDTQLAMGHRFPIGRAAAGRALLAYMPREQVVQLVGDEVADELADEFEQIREAGGIAFQRGVYGDMSSICATIFDGSGTPVAVLLIGGLELETHLTPDSAPARALRRTADAIARALP